MQAMDSLQQACHKLLESKPASLEQDEDVLRGMQMMLTRDETAELAVQWRLCQKGLDAHRFALKT